MHPSTFLPFRCSEERFYLSHVKATDIPVKEFKWIIEG